MDSNNYRYHEQNPPQINPQSSSLLHSDWINHQETLNVGRLLNEKSPTSMIHQYEEEDKKILEKYDIQIFQSDLETLNDWLSDAIVNFAALEIYENLKDYIKAIVNIVPSTSCDIIKYVVSPQIPLIFETLDLTLEKWQFFMFNNNSNFGNHRGSHWSLLLFHPDEKCFYHADSIGDGYVSDLMQNLASKIMLQWKIPLSHVKSLNCPHMRFSGDCGIYLIEYLRCILENLTDARKWNDFQNMMSYEYMRNRRVCLKKLILDLAENKEQPVIFSTNDLSKAINNDRAKEISTKSLDIPSSSASIQPYKEYKTGDHVLGDYKLDGAYLEYNSNTINNLDTSELSLSQPNNKIEDYRIMNDYQTPKLKEEQRPLQLTNDEILQISRNKRKWTPDIDDRQIEEKGTYLNNRCKSETIIHHSICQTKLNDLESSNISTPCDYGSNTTRFPAHKQPFILNQNNSLTSSSTQFSSQTTTIIWEIPIKHI